MSGCSGETLRTENVVLATGLGIPDIPAIPVPEGLEDQIVHSSKVDLRQRNGGTKSILIVGGGLTGGTLAVNLARRENLVTLLTREPLRVQPFDFDPRWFGGDLFRAFEAAPDAERRAVILEQANVRGSITPDIRRQMIEMEKGGFLKIYEHREVTGFEKSGRLNDLSINVAAGETERIFGSFNQVILATGYSALVSNTPCLGKIAERIPAVNGLPVLTRNLEVYGFPRLFITGALAKLATGPAASNVYGAYIAAERIASKILN